MRPSIWASTSARTRSSGRPRALATRGTWNSAASGEMCGIEAAARGGHQHRPGPAADGFSFLSVSTSALTRSISALLVGPRFEPIELAAL